jgi:hypothetical protein
MNRARDACAVGCHSARFCCHSLGSRVDILLPIGGTAADALALGRCVALSGAPSYGESLRYELQNDVGLVATPSAPRNSAHRRVGHLEDSFVSSVRGGQAFPPLTQPWRLVVLLVRHWVPADPFWVLEVRLEGRSSRSRWGGGRRVPQLGSRQRLHGGFRGGRCTERRRYAWRGLAGVAL